MDFSTCSWWVLVIFVALKMHLINSYPITHFAGTQRRRSAQQRGGRSAPIESQNVRAQCEQSDAWKLYWWCLFWQLLEQELMSSASECDDEQVKSLHQLLFLSHHSVDWWTLLWVHLRTQHLSIKMETLVMIWILSKTHSRDHLAIKFKSNGDLWKKNLSEILLKNFNLIPKLVLYPVSQLSLKTTLFPAEFYNL